MEIIGTILLTMCIALLLLTTYIMIRNIRVYTFRMSVLADIDSEATKRNEQNAITSKEISQMYGILGAVSYNKMLFSFKPLKVEYWFTEEEIKLLGYERDIPNR